MAVDFSVVPSDVSDWPATTAPFNTQKYGEKVEFTGDNSIVERLETRRSLNFVVYTREPLPLGQVWQTTVLKTTTRTRWGGLVSVCFQGIYALSITSLVTLTAKVFVSFCILFSLLAIVHVE